MNAINILGINGSIRINSSSHAVMNEVIENLPANTNFNLFDRLADIPAFDGSEIDPEPVADFKSQINLAHAIIICTPEYAFGVPGALKNAIDWTVGSGDLFNKPVALITASSNGEKGHDALQHILIAIAAKTDPATTLLISSIRSKVKDGKIIDVPTAELIKKVSLHLVFKFQKQ
jgi:chromate reductase, NAD(P)H dehydrogenase (quinone)